VISFKSQTKKKWHIFQINGGGWGGYLDKDLHREIWKREWSGPKIVDGGDLWRVRKIGTKEEERKKKEPEPT
jgi:hypothetical protein